jgi:PleD family two-component response regulator
VDSPGQLFAQVDLALYRAKNSGRNAVEVVGARDALRK